MKIEVIDLQDQPDGSAQLTLDLSPEAILLFAKKGILAAIREALVEIVQEHGPDPS